MHKNHFADFKQGAFQGPFSESLGGAFFFLLFLISFHPVGFDIHTYIYTKIFFILMSSYGIQ